MFISKLAHQTPMQTMRTEFMEELRLLQNMRTSLGAQLHKFQLIMASMEPNKFPEASVLFKILKQIKEIVEIHSPPPLPTFQSLRNRRQQSSVVEQSRTRLKQDTELSPKMEPKKIRLDNVSPSIQTDSGAATTIVSPVVPPLPLPAVTTGQFRNPPPPVNNVGLQLLDRPELLSQPFPDVQIIEVKEKSKVTSSSLKKVIWCGSLEWTELQKVGSASEVTQKLQRELPCEVTASGQELGTEGWFVGGWSNKLSMQLIPKSIILALGTPCFKGVQSVSFHFPNSSTTESLTKIMTTGFAGCVHFVEPKSEESGTAVVNSSKLFLLLYSKQRNHFIGFIPRDQPAFRDRFMMVMGQAKTTVASSKVNTDEEWESFVTMSSLE